MQADATLSKDQDPRERPEFYLASSESESDSESEVRQVRVEDQGSQPRCAKVEIQGVPAFGIIDSGADITILGGELFKKVAAVAKLRKKDLKKANKSPHTYDGQPFSLDGRMDLDISFKGKTLCTPVYIKMDAQDQLLLSEGVCRQLKILSYDPDVEVWRGGRRRSHGRNRREQPQPGTSAAKVPTVRVRLVRTVRLPPRQTTVVKARVEKGLRRGEPLLLEPDSHWQEAEGLEIVPTIGHTDKHSHLYVVIANPTGYTQHIHHGTGLGRAFAAEVVELSKEPVDEDNQMQVNSTDNLSSPSTNHRGGATAVGERVAQETEDSTWPREECLHRPCSVSDGQSSCTVSVSSQNNSPQVQQVITTDKDTQRRQALEEALFKEGSCLSEEDQRIVHDALMDRHTAFALEEGERGETDLIQLEIDTGDATPIRQPHRRLPLAVRQEVARQLKGMQEAGIIKPSNSPWASPIVLVRKKNGTLRFCVDYRKLNAVTRADTFPLPRIDDLLDQLGCSKYFSTLDLAAGYWQIPLCPESQDKSAFVTHQGLYQFQVMPFGLRNAPAVFQRMMQRVLMGLNPEEGPDFVEVYLDDVLVFSQTLEAHLHHLTLVLDRLVEAGLKLQPSKCYFAREEVQYLGHLITPSGLKPNPERVSAVKEFPVPQCIKEVRQFVGLASYFRRFIPLFASIAHPLHSLTRKGEAFNWTPACQTAFDTLKQRLVEAPVLAYPNLDKSYTLETDASSKGLGAILSQEQHDGKLHPVAYASRALSNPEKNYGITDLETLAVVWSISHFHAYLYGNDVTVYTDHSAVKPVLETPSPSGKHARWWTKVYSRGVKTVKIIYRAGKENIGADALSRKPPAAWPSGRTCGNRHTRTGSRRAKLHRIHGSVKQGSRATDY